MNVDWIVRGKLRVPGKAVGNREGRINSLVRGSV